MNPYTKQFLLSIGLSSLVILPNESTAGKDEVIAKARAHLGGDSNLDAIVTIQYFGRFEVHPQEEEASSEDEDREGTIQIILEKPMRQRQVVKQKDVVRITVVDNYDGWRSIKRLNEPDKLELQILGTGELKRLRANTFENLSFFSGIEKLQGKIIDKGEVMKDGRSAHLLVFQYADDIYYERYFDVETGELIATVTDQGIEMREKGKVVIAGVKFPDRVESLVEGNQFNTVFFEEIIVNEAIDDSLFEMPSFIPSKRRDID